MGGSGSAVASVQTDSRDGTGQRRILPSSPDEAIVRPSGLNAMPDTEPRWSMSGAPSGCEAGAGALLAQPRLTSFAKGRRRQAWDKNVIAIGAAAGFLEPLVASDVHLLSSAMFNLLDHFPDKQFDAAVIASFNAGIREDFERVRDFILLHYRASRRDDSPFWQQFAPMALPQSLQLRLDLYRASGRIIQHGPEPFTDLDWFFVFEGMGIVPRDYDPLVDVVDFEQVKRLMLAVSQKVAADVAAAPTHDSFFAAANARLAGARKAAAASTG